jgi:hypothetical protein
VISTFALTSVRAATAHAAHAVAREVQQRVRDGELDPGEHEEVPEVHGSNREESGLQSHDLQEQGLQEGVLLGVP